jgi:hypothetical protein
MAAVAGPSTKPVNPFYCEVCTLPTEYCEFGPSFSKCKAWLESEDRQEFDRLWGEGTSLIPFKCGGVFLIGLGSLAGRIGTLSMDKQEKLEKDAEKAEKKAEKKAEAEQKKKEVSIHSLSEMHKLISRLPKYVIQVQSRVRSGS